MLEGSQTNGVKKERESLNQLPVLLTEALACALRSRTGNAEPHAVCYVHGNAHAHHLSKVAYRKLPIVASFPCSE